MNDLMELAEQFPLGKYYKVDHDGFEGFVIGYYVTREGWAGLVLQMNNTKVVHVYSTKWFEK